MQEVRKGERDKASRIELVTGCERKGKKMRERYSRNKNKRGGKKERERRTN